MAQAGFTPISLYFSSTAAAVPTSGNLANGELALNIADMKLYAKNSAGVVTLLASNAATSGVSSFSAGTTGFTPSTATTGAVTLAGTLNVANGGTGLTSLTANRIPYGNGTSAFQSSSALTFDGTNFATTGRVSALDFVATGSSFYALVSGSTYGSLTATAGTATVNANNGNALIFQVASTETGRFNSSGAFGVGIVPQTGWSGFKALQIGANTSMWASTSGGGSSYYSNNLYYNGSNRIYITSGNASEYQQTNTGTHSWFTAASGTAGNAVSLNTAMTLDLNGNLVTTGSVTAYSDERLKKDWSELPSNFVERLANVKSGTYTRIDNGIRQAGSSAQDWQSLLPEVVLAGEDEDKTLSLAYGNAALVSVIELAKRFVALKAEVTALKGTI